MKITKLFFIAILLSTTSCPLQGTMEPTISNPDLLNITWVHSFEEEVSSDQKKIYRPSNYKKFPATRFREKYHFLQNGVCEYLFLHPTDAHYMEKANWKNETNNSEIITIFDSQTKIIKKFKIIELTKDKLMIQELKKSLQYKD